MKHTRRHIPPGVIDSRRLPLLPSVAIWAQALPVFRCKLQHIPSADHGVASHTRKVMLGGRKGNLCPFEQMRAFALAEAQEAAGMERDCEWIANRVKKGAEISLSGFRGRWRPRHPNII